jgi:hypothetical protein
MATVRKYTRPTIPPRTPARWQATIAAAVRSLSDAERRNIAYHMHAQTPIVCGRHFAAFIGPGGAA